MARLYSAGVCRQNQAGTGISIITKSATTTVYMQCLPACEAWMLYSHMEGGQHSKEGLHAAETMTADLASTRGQDCTRASAHQPDFSSTELGMSVHQVFCCRQSDQIMSCSTERNAANRNSVVPLGSRLQLVGEFAPVSIWLPYQIWVVMVGELGEETKGRGQSLALCPFPAVCVVDVRKATCGEGKHPSHHNGVKQSMGLRRPYLTCSYCGIGRLKATMQVCWLSMSVPAISSVGACVFEEYGHLSLLLLTCPV